MQYKFSVCVPDMHVYIIKLSCTDIVHTRELLTIGLMSSVLRAHACLHIWEIKNVLCRAHAACMFPQV